MESDEGAPSTGQQPETLGTAEEAQAGVHTAAQQPDPVEVQETTKSPQQPEPQRADRVEPTAAQKPDPTLTSESATARDQQPETKGARDGREERAERLEATCSSSAVHTICRSMSPPSTLHSWIVNQTSLLQDAIAVSSSGSSSDWISNATDPTNSSPISLHSYHARRNGHFHKDGNDNGNGDGQSGTFRQATRSPKLSEPSLATDGASRQEATQADQPHDTSSGSAPVSRKDSTVTNTSSVSLNFSSTSSASDPMRSDILGLRRSNVLDTDEYEMDQMGNLRPLMNMVEACSVLDTNEDEMDEMGNLRPLMNMVEAYCVFSEEFEHPQTEEYIMDMIKRYVDIASTLTADVYSIARKVFGSSDDAEPTGRESPYQMTEEQVERSESRASLERRLQAVRDYVRTTSDATTEAAIAEMIIQEYHAEKVMAESGVRPDAGSPTTREASSDVAHEVVQDRVVKQSGKTYTDSDGATDGVKEVPIESSVQTDSGSVRREIVQAEEALGASSVNIGMMKEESDWSCIFGGSYSDEDDSEYIIFNRFQKIYPETERLRKIRKAHQKVAVLKIFSLAELRVCVIRNMNWVMLTCLKTVTSIVNRALEANRVAHRAISEAEALRSAGTSGDYIDAMAESATAASQCAETAVREIEEAVQLHKFVVDALNLSERALFNIKKACCDGADLIRQLFWDVELIEMEVTWACRTYLDKAKYRDSPDSGSSLVFPTSDGIHGPIVSMAFDDVEGGPSDVFQALIWASHSSVNAIEKMVKGLRDFSIAKHRHRRKSDNK